MKKTVIGILISPILFTACSKEQEDHYIQASYGQADIKSLTAEGLNPYERVGQVQNDLLDLYLTQSHQEDTLFDTYKIIENLANSYEDTLLTEIPPASLIVDGVSQILSDSQASLNLTLSDSGLSDQAKISLTDFIGFLLSDPERTNEELCLLITDFEASVIENPLFSTKDKEIILTTFVLTRYMLHYAGGRKDKDWEITVGNITAGLKGSMEGPATGIFMSLVADIHLNPNAY